MSFVWAGCALLVRSVARRRRGGVAEEPRRRDRSATSGSRRRPWSLLVVVAVIWIPLRGRASACRSTRSAATGWRRSGAACRSAGRRSSPTRSPACSRRSPACRSPRAPGSGRPCPGPYTLLSVAAVVLGGVSLAGGRGGVFGPIVGGRRPPADPDRHDVPERRPEPRARRPGRRSSSAWSMFGSLVQLRRARAMTGRRPGPRIAGATAAPGGACFRDRPIVPLIGPARSSSSSSSSSRHRASSAPRGPASSCAPPSRSRSSPAARP